MLTSVVIKRRPGGSLEFLGNAIFTNVINLNLHIYLYGACKR